MPHIPARHVLLSNDSMPREAFSTEGEGERREGGDKEEVYSERTRGTQAPEAVVPRGLGRLFRVGSEEEEEGQMFKSTVPSNFCKYQQHFYRRPTMFLKMRFSSRRWY
jgi:hypothetical protein